MARLKYFKQVDAKKATKIGIVLPKPNGPLSSVMPSSRIESADVAVKKAMLMASRVTTELLKVMKLKTINIHARIHVQTRSHQQMMLKNILNTGKRARKRVIIRKYFFKIFGLPLFLKI